jgi:chemotaxis protein methyltransferase CheR
LPADLAAAFRHSPDRLLHLVEEYRRDVEFRVQDIRMTSPEGRFHLIRCRYLAFAYFDEALQHRTLRLLRNNLEPGGVLVVGAAERMPDDLAALVPMSARLRIYRAASAIPAAKAT